MWPSTVSSSKYCEWEYLLNYINLYYFKDIQQYVYMLMELNNIKGKVAIYLYLHVKEVIQNNIVSKI